MRSSTSSRLRSMSSSESASRLSRSSGSVFDGRTFRCQSSASTEIPSRCETLPSAPKRSLISWSFDGDVRDRDVDLAGQEVALAVRAQELGQRLAALRDELQHEQERNHARVGLEEVPEVVVAGDLAGEGGVLLADALLDERVADTVDERDPAGALDRLRHGPARAHVVDDLRARILLQHRLGEERRHEVARDELAGVVDEEAPVGVAVEGRAEVGAVLAHLADHELAVLGEERVRLVIREGAVRLEVVRDGVDRDPFEHGRQHHAGHPVRRVDHHAPLLDRIEVDEGQHLVHEGRKDILLPDLSWDLVPGRGRRGHGPVADVQKARVAADGQRASAHDLHPGVLLRVVRRGHLDAAVEPEVADGEVEHLGADEPDVDHLGPSGRSALDRRLRHRGRRDAHVPPDRNPLRLELLDVAAPDRARSLLVEVDGVDPAHVVRLEDFWIEHRRDGKRGLDRSYT